MFTLLTALVLLAGSPAVRQPDQAQTITVRDYVIEGPDRISGPLVSLIVDNQGTEPHYVRFLRIAGDRTAADFAAWRKAGGPMPSWLDASGGVGTVAPGHAAGFTAQMRPGRYIIYCGHPSPDGTFHDARGMYRLVTVTERGTAGTRLGDGTILLSEHAVRIFRPMTAGTQTYLVKNEGALMHQALLVHLPPGVTVEQELAWFTGGSRGVRPGRPVGGVIELLPGAEARVTLDLPPGRYALFCAIATPAGRHFDRGMIETFEVR